MQGLWTPVPPKVRAVVHRERLSSLTMSCFTQLTFPEASVTP